MLVSIGPAVHGGDLSAACQKALCILSFKCQEPFENQSKSGKYIAVIIFWILENKRFSAYTTATIDLCGSNAIQNSNEHLLNNKKVCRRLVQPFFSDAMAYGQT